MKPVYWYVPICSGRFASTCPSSCQSTALCGTLLRPGNLSLSPVGAPPGCREPSELPEPAAGEPGHCAVAPDAIVLQPGKGCTALLGARSPLIYLSTGKKLNKNGYISQDVGLQRARNRLMTPAGPVLPPVLRCLWPRITNPGRSPWRACNARSENDCRILPHCIILVAHSQRTGTAKWQPGNRCIGSVFPAEYFGCIAKSSSSWAQVY